MKTLYVSDLDGTLLNKEKQVTKFTVDVLNEFIGNGGLFSVATARMAYGCDYKLSEIKLNIPGIIMNGVCLYSFKDKKYIDVEVIDHDKVIEIEHVFDKHDYFGFMYTYSDNFLSIFYRNENDLQFTQYYSKQAREACKEISITNNFASVSKNKNVIYFGLTGEKELIYKIWNDIKPISGIGSAIYLNIYNDLYCLEIFNKNASKANALKKLKDIVKADEIVVFGDNHNDIDMINIADKSYAPENAVAEVKNIVNGIIPSCDDDGVAKFLKGLNNGVSI